LLYISADPDLQTVLEIIEKNGGKILLLKTRITDAYGDMAIFLGFRKESGALQSDQ
jgi:predicted enzyme related to lactoylglutathione lyase